MRSALLLVVATLLTGCGTAVASVRSAPPAEVAARLDGRPVTVVMADGATYEARALRMEADSTTWIRPETQTLVAVATADVAEILRRDRTRATVRCAGIGVLAGLVSAALRTTVCTSLDCGDNDWASSTSLVLGGMAVAAGTGAGALTGAVLNPATRWRLGPSAPTAPASRARRARGLQPGAGR